MAIPSIKRLFVACALPAVVSCADRVASPDTAKSLVGKSLDQLPLNPSEGHEGEADQFDIARELPS